MPHNIEDYMPAKDAAVEIGIEYSLLMARIYKGQVKSIKQGWGQFIHRDEVAREKQRQKEMERKRDADNEDMGGTAG